MSPALAGKFFTTSVVWEAPNPLGRLLLPPAQHQALGPGQLRENAGPVLGSLVKGALRKATLPRCPASSLQLG